MRAIVLCLAAALPASGGWHGMLRAGVGARAPAVRLVASSDTDAELLARLRAKIAVDVAADGRQRVRPSSVRTNGLDEAGLHYAEASLASTTGPVFNADDLPGGAKLMPAQAIRGLYAAFNARDAACAGSFLTDDCVYEDLLLGPATVCRGKEAFMNALSFHPAFVSSRLFGSLPFADLLPPLTLEVDSIAEGADTVGVEWHVQVGESAFPLGRGLSQARVCTATGKIERVVDIAEAPWRVIGLFATPVIFAVQQVVGALSQARDASGAAEASASPATDGAATASDGLLMGGGVDAQREYELLLSAVLADEIVDPAERRLLADYAAQNRVTPAQHAAILARAGWSEAEFQEGRRAVAASGS